MFTSSHPKHLPHTSGVCTFWCLPQLARAHLPCVVTIVWSLMGDVDLWHGLKKQGGSWDVANFFFLWQCSAGWGYLPSFRPDIIVYAELCASDAISQFPRLWELEFVSRVRDAISWSFLLQKGWLICLNSIINTKISFWRRERCQKWMNQGSYPLQIWISLYCVLHKRTGWCHSQPRQHWPKPALLLWSARGFEEKKNQWRH